MKIDANPFNLSAEELESSISDIEFWKKKFPKLSITTEEERYELPIHKVTKQKLEKEKERLLTDGYFIFDSLHKEEELSDLRDCMESCYENNAFPIFASLFDSFWDIIYQHTNSIQSLLGHPYYVLPDNWAWVVTPTEENSGWPPHRDKLFPVIREDGTPNSLTLWIPLTDTCPENGCISILPASLDPNYPNNPELQIPNIQDIRALPAAKGSLLGWNQAIIHWGGRCSKWAKTPRISLAFEIQRQDIAPFNEPLLNPDTRPSFQDRLKLVGKQILQYQHMYKLSETYKALGHALVQEKAEKATPLSA